MSTPIKIAEIEAEVASCEKDFEGCRGEFSHPEDCETCSRLVPLLRLAVAAKAVADNINPDVGCKKPCPDCEFHRALEAFDFGSEEPSA